MRAERSTLHVHRSYGDTIPVGILFLCMEFFRHCHPEVAPILDGTVSSEAVMKGNLLPDHGDTNMHT